MNAHVVDSSVVFKWFRQEGDEPYVAAALSVLENYLQGEVELCAPDLLIYEIGNVLKGKLRYIKEDIAGVIEDLFGLGLTYYYIDPALALNAMRTAADYDLTFYDASFVALARMLDVDFITADEKLYRTTKDLPGVHFLGTYE